MTNVKIKSPNDLEPVVEASTKSVPFQTEFGTGNYVINVNDQPRDEPQPPPNADVLTHVNFCMRVPD